MSCWWLWEYGLAKVLQSLEKSYKEASPRRPMRGAQHYKASFYLCYIMVRNCVLDELQDCQP